MIKNGIILGFLMLFSGTLYAELNTDEVSRDICVNKKGYEQGYYGNNKSVVCRKSVDSEEMPLSSLPQRTLFGQSYSFDEAFNVEVFNYEGDDMESLVVRPVNSYVMYSKNLRPDQEQKTVANGTLIDHENNLDLFVTPAYEVLTLSEHKMTFNPSRSAPSESVSANVVVENQNIVEIELKKDSEVIGTFSITFDQTYHLKNARVKLSTKEHDTNHDLANIDTYEEHFTGLLSVTVEGKKAEWVGFFNSTDPANSIEQKLFGNNVLELRRVTGKDTQGNYLYEEAVSLGLQIVREEQGAEESLVLYKYVDGVPVKL
jgi:hypothetical protein